MGSDPFPPPSSDAVPMIVFRAAQADPHKLMPSPMEVALGRLRNSPYPASRGDLSKGNRKKQNPADNRVSVVCVWPTGNGRGMKRKKKRRPNEEASYFCDACGEEIVIPLDLSAGKARSTSRIVRSAAARTSFMLRSTAVMCGCGPKGNRSDLHFPRITNSGPRTSCRCCHSVPPRRCALAANSSNCL